MILFGQNLAALLLALAQVESNCGATSRNVYQITSAYLADVNRVVSLCRGRWPIHYKAADALDRERSHDVMMVYLSYWGSRYMRETGRVPTLEVLARIHNGGPFGWRKAATLPYWRKVQAALSAQGEGDGELWLNLSVENYNAARGITQKRKNK